MFAELIRKRNELHVKRTALRDYMASSKNDAGELDPKTKLGIDGTKFAEEVRAKNAEIEALGKAVQDLAVVEQVESEMKAWQTANPGRDPLHVGDPGGGGEKKSVGNLFVNSPAFKDFRKGATQGPMADLDVDFKTLFETGAGWDPQDIRTGIVTPIATRPAPNVTNFIPQIPTTQSSIVYMEETTFTNNASEATEGATYGEGVLALTERTTAVRKIAVFLPITDEQLEDVPQAEAYVNGRLRLMAMQRLDSQVLVGTGIMPSGLTGTENVSGIQTQALSTDNIPDAIFKLFVKIRDDGFAEPSVCFIRPSKWQTVALLKTSDGIYIWGHPSTAGPTQIWGVPVVQTTAVTTTKVVAGDYTTHAFLAIKRGLQMQISSSHSTYFVEGKQAIRMDMRAAMVHLRPKAFGTVTGL